MTKGKSPLPLSILICLPLVLQLSRSHLHYTLRSSTAIISNSIIHDVTGQRFKETQEYVHSLHSLVFVGICSTQITSRVVRFCRHEMTSDVAHITNYSLISTRLLTTLSTSCAISEPLFGLYFFTHTHTHTLYKSIANYHSYSNIAVCILVSFFKAIKQVGHNQQFSSPRAERQLVNLPVFLSSKEGLFCWFWNKNSRTALSSWTRQNSSRQQDMSTPSRPGRGDTGNQPAKLTLASSCSPNGKQQRCSMMKLALIKKTRLLRDPLR